MEEDEVAYQNVVLFSFFEGMFRRLATEKFDRMFRGPVMLRMWRRVCDVTFFFVGTHMYACGGRVGLLCCPFFLLDLN